MIHILKHNKTPVFISGVLLCLFFSVKASSQESAIQSNVEHKVNLYNVNGKPFENPYIDISGTPFFNKAWKYGIIIIDEHTVFGNIQLRLNLLDQQVHFKKADNVELVINAGVVKQISLFDSSGKSPVNYVFQCGFPSIDNQNEKNFYQILSDGKIKFLKSLKKSIHEEKDGFSGEIHKEFRLYEDYYFLVKNNIERIKRDKDYLLAYMNDKKRQIDAFLQMNKISFKSMDDIKKLVDYYNSQ